MTESDVEEYADRSKTLIEKSPGMNEQNVRDKLIRPLIEILGWDLYLDVESEYTVQIGTKHPRVDYALLVDDTPDVFIETKSQKKSLNGDHKGQLASYMRQAGTDWGLLTNGKLFQVLKHKSGSSASEEMVLAEVSLDNLIQDWNILEIISKENVESGEAHQLADQLDTRKQAINSLRENKRAIIDEVTDVFIDYTSDVLQQDVEMELDLFIDDLIEDLDTEPSDDGSPSTVDEILDVVGTALPGRTDEERQNRAAVILSVFKFLQRQETASRDEIQQYLLKQHSDNFSEEGADFDQHWTNYLLNGLAELPRIEQPARGAAQIWRYVPPELDQEIRVEEINDEILELGVATSGNGESIERQQALIQQAYDYIQTNGKATKDDLEEILPSYTAHYLGFDGFWTSTLREAFIAIDDVDKPTRGHQHWYYVGDGALPSNLDVEMEDWVFEQEIPGQGITKEERQALLQISYNYLKKTGSAKRGDFETYFDTNLPNQTGKYRNFNGLWSYLLMDTLKNAPEIETEGSEKRGPTTYRHIG